MSAKLSKTPWIVERNFAWSKNVDVRSADDKQVAFVGSLNEADALIIASAPMLLEALEYLVTIEDSFLVGNDFHGAIHKAVKQARAAIAAARGE